MKTNIFFTEKQEGYGRTGLSFEFDSKKYYVRSFFPNVHEDLGITQLEDCIYDEEKEKYFDENGNETTPYEDLDEFLFERYKEEIGQILFENLDHESYNFDFVHSSYEEIAEWAKNY